MPRRGHGCGMTAVPWILHTGQGINGAVEGISPSSMKDITACISLTIIIFGLILPAATQIHLSADWSFDLYYISCYTLLCFIEITCFFN